MSIHIIDKHVGQKLRQFRTLAGMTQKQLADKLGVTFQQVQKYEIGSNRVSASRLHDIGKVLNVPVSAFFPEDSENPEFSTIDSREAALIRAYRSAPPEIRTAIHSLTSSLEAA